MILDFNGIEHPDFVKKTIDTSKGSSDIGDAIATLPSDHSWDTIRIDSYGGLAKCSVCGYELVFGSYSLEYHPITKENMWLDFNQVQKNWLNYKKCDDVLMQKALM